MTFGSEFPVGYEAVPNTLLEITKEPINFPAE
jgi:hypothetical protein